MIVFAFIITDCIWFSQSQPKRNRRFQFASHCIIAKFECW